MTIYECRKCGSWETLISDIDIHYIEEHGCKKGDKITFAVPYSGIQYDIRERTIKNIPKGVAVELPLPSATQG